MSRDGHTFIVKLSCTVVSESLRSHRLHVALQAPLSMGLSQQKYWSGLPFPPPGIFLTLGSSVSLALAGRCFTRAKPKLGIQGKKVMASALQETPFLRE